jgi:hypothetical protein
LAFKFAFESVHISVEAVSVVARPELARIHKVLGTPHTLVNEEQHLSGRLQEADLLEAIQSL